METPRDIKDVKNIDDLQKYLNQFVDCYDQKLTMFLKVRSMILALHEKIPESFKENSITVTNLLNDNIDTKLKQKYLKKTQDPSLNKGTTDIKSFIQGLIIRFCNKGLDLSNFPIYKGKNPKPMYQTLLLEIMSDNYATKKLIEKEEPTNNSPITIVGDSPKFSSTVSSVSTGNSTGTKVMNYMMSPMSPVKKILFSTTTTTLDSNDTPSRLNRDEHIKGKIDGIGSNEYHKVYSASKFWSLFRDHYNENCNQLQGDLNKKDPVFNDTNTFYNQKVRNMQIIWKHVMLLKKRRQGLYQLLRKTDDTQTANESLPKNINNFQGEFIDEAQPFKTISVVTEPKPETLQNFMEQMSTAIAEEPNFPVAANIKVADIKVPDIEVEKFMRIPEPPSLPEQIPSLPAPLPSNENIATEIVKILENTISNKEEKDPDTYFENIRKQHYLAMEILLQYKANRQDIDNEDLAQILELVDEEIYFVPQINVGGQETQDVYYYNNVAKYGIFDKKNVANNFLYPKKQSTQELTQDRKPEKLLELLDWMATNLHVFVGHYNLLRVNLEVIFKYIHDNKLKIFSENGTYTSNNNEKLIVDYLKVFIEAIKDSDEFNTFKSNVVDLDVDITETEEGVIVIKEKLMDINGLLDKINNNINAICADYKDDKLKDRKKEFNNITSIVKDLMCLKNKAEAPAVTEEGEQCQRVTGEVPNDLTNKVKKAITKLFLKLIDKAVCVNKHVFTFLGTMSSGNDVTYAEDQINSKNKKIQDIHKENSMQLRKHLWTLYEYISPDHTLFKENELKYSTRGSQKITEIIGTWNKISSKEEHKNELIMIYKKIPP